MFTIFSLKSIIKQLLDLVYGFLHLKYIIKQLLDSLFVIYQIINVAYCEIQGWGSSIIYCKFVHVSQLDLETNSTILRKYKMH